MKILIRKQMRAQRRALSAREHRLRSDEAAKRVMRLRMFASGKRVAVYLPFDGEMDTAALLRAARRRGVRLYVPAVSDRRHRRMGFYPLANELREGHYGISVPMRCLQPLGPQWLDLIVLPLVAVDAAGRRLGLGAGYYDRALAFRRRRRAWQGPCLAGMAFDFQRSGQPFAEIWDVKLNCLATESGVQQFHEPLADQIGTGELQHR